MIYPLLSRRRRARLVRLCGLTSGLLAPIVSAHFPPNENHVHHIRRKLALFILDSRPSATFLRSILWICCVLAVALGVKATAKLWMVREESRATQRYLQALELFNDRRDAAIDRLRGENSFLARRDRMWQLSMQVAAAAGRRGTRLSNQECIIIADAVAEAAKTYGVPEELILGVISQESRFDRRAVSSKGALGLMQLMPATAASLARELDLPRPDTQALLEPRLNVRLGTYYLKTLLAQSKSLPDALTSYYLGPGANSGIQWGYVGGVSRARADL